MGAAAVQRSRRYLRFGDADTPSAIRSKSTGLPAIGQRVRVLWDDVDTWYGGTVQVVDAVIGEAFVLYDDGAGVWEAFWVGSGTTWAFEEDHARPPNGRNGVVLTASMDGSLLTEMAVRVLREAGRCLSAGDIISAAVTLGWRIADAGDSRTSSAVQTRLRNHLYRMTRKRVDPIFSRTGKGVYGLVEWVCSDQRHADGDDGSLGKGGAGLPDALETRSTRPLGDHSRPTHLMDDTIDDTVNDIEDYGDLPRWGPDNKAVRGPAMSLPHQTPTAHETMMGGYEYSEEDAGSDDDDLYGEDRKWAIDLPDAQSIAPDIAADEASTVQMIDASGHVSTCQLSALDLDVSREEVADRIAHVCDFVTACIGEQRLPSISLESGTASRPAFTMESNMAIVRFARMMIALDIIHENLVAEYNDTEDPEGITRITQRDLYYIARSRSASIKAPQMMQTIQDVSLMLNVPRFAMGIDCRSKGIVYGPIQLQQPGGAVSCMRPRGSPISGSVPEIMKISSVSMDNVSAIVVVEKETVFQRIVREAPSHPVLSRCVIITGCGYPDVGTRAFLFKITGQDRSVPVVGLVDWNASGAHILSQCVLFSLMLLAPASDSLPAHLLARSGTHMSGTAMDPEGLWSHRYSVFHR